GIDLTVDDSDPASATTFDYFDWAEIAPNSYAQPFLWKQVRFVGTPPPVADTTPPSVTITSPTSNATYSTSSSSLMLGGTTADNVGVTQVTWTNSRGGSGTATGTTSWTASGIVLQLGTNVLTVTAQDAAGNTATASLTVTFTPTFALTVSKAGTGSGTVTSSPAGITCGATCSAPYASGTVVTLTATPSANSAFTGWSGGGCSGTGERVSTRLH